MRSWAMAKLPSEAAKWSGLLESRGLTGELTSSWLAWAKTKATDFISDLKIIISSCKSDTGTSKVWSLTCKLHPRGCSRSRGQKAEVRGILCCCIWPWWTVLCPLASMRVRVWAPSIYAPKWNWPWGCPWRPSRPSGPEATRRGQDFEREICVSLVFDELQSIRCRWERPNWCWPNQDLREC